MSGRWIKYSEEEFEFIKENSSLPRRELADQLNARFGRSLPLMNIKLPELTSEVKELLGRSNG